ncbi:uncharacterized protein AtWU_06868 [Aspergillus tubingensis]|uniref:uncharacterized protein n=1 Tax=Aspergillus tubingensis TaxID=5068 RepID=UPI0015791218|nr:1-pyrroline-5-carboxylate dehydrogenase [Aspergillus tubingensis]GFN17066.1 1-pyrroline-5-carboxylate dehydrogenase [Aspergillus tubingensis]
MFKRAATAMGLFWALLFCHSLAFPFEPFPTDTDVVPSANVSDLLPKHLVKRASRYPRVKYGPTCSAEEQAYIDTELDELQPVMIRVMRQLRDIRAVIREKEQPANWGTRFADNDRILTSWASMMGRTRFNYEVELKENQDNLASWTMTSRNMQFMISVYSRIYNALRDRTLALTIHCGDEFYVFDKDVSTKNTRVYRDTRSTEFQPYMILPEPGRLCHENGGGNGWQMWNKLTVEDEICICPRVFDNAKTSQTLSSLDNTVDSLKGRHVDYIKKFTAAGSLLHELSHCRGILGDDQTSPFIDGYQRNGVWAVSKIDPAGAHRNAGNTVSAQPPLSM